MSDIRARVFGAFNRSDHYFNHVSPYGYTNFIDGMAWVGLMCGAALRVGDTELAEECRCYLKQLVYVGPDARNYAPGDKAPGGDHWVASPTVFGFKYYLKAQSFAGPAGLEFANQCGAGVESPYHRSVYSKAKMFTALGMFYGWLYRPVPWLRQHANSMFLAYLIRKKHPPRSMRWLCLGNPFFSYIAGEHCNVLPLATRKFVNGKTVESKTYVTVPEAKPSIWPFRHDVFRAYEGDGTLDSRSYTPIAELCATYLQHSL